MTLTEQPSTRMVVFHNVVFKNDNGCENDNGMISVGLPIKQQQQQPAQRVERPSVLVRLSKRLSNLSHSTAPMETFPPLPSSQPMTVVSSPPSSSFERQNSSESDLSLSKLDITDDYSGVGGNESLNTSQQASELDITGRKTSLSTTSQRLTESFRNIYSRFSQKRSITKTNTSTSSFGSNTRLAGQVSTSNQTSIFDHRFFSCCSQCFSIRTHSSSSVVTTSPRRSFLF